jgi:hypothetical protein
VEKKLFEMATNGNIKAIQFFLTNNCPERYHSFAAMPSIQFNPKTEQNQNLIALSSALIEHAKKIDVVSEITSSQDDEIDNILGVEE